MCHQSDKYSTCSVSTETINLFVSKETDQWSHRCSIMDYCLSLSVWITIKCHVIAACASSSIFYSCYIISHIIVLNLKLLFESRTNRLIPVFFLRRWSKICFIIIYTRSLTTLRLQHARSHDVLRLYRLFYKRPETCDGNIDIYKRIM